MKSVFEAFVCGLQLRGEAEVDHEAVQSKTHLIQRKVASEKQKYEILSPDHCVEFRHGRSRRDMCRKETVNLWEHRVSIKAGGHAVHG